MLHYQYMIVYKNGQTIVGRATASNFRGHKKVTLWKIEKKKLFPNRELNRYPIGLKANTLPLIHPYTIAPERKRIYCIRNVESFTLDFNPG